MLLLSLCITMLVSAKVYNVRDYGAVGDGTHIDSPPIDETIAKATDCGDTVVVPAGIYLCYSVHLKSNVTIILEKGAVIKAAKPTEHLGYDASEPADTLYQDFGHSHWHNSLLWGEEIENVCIEGEGLIDGSGVLSRSKQRTNKFGQPLANKALAMKNCKKVTVKGLKFLNCGHFAVLMTGVDDLLISKLRIDTNRDGIDIDCCERVVVEDCNVNTLNDDAVVLKCSYALGWAKPTKDVLIENCRVSGYDVGSMMNNTFTTNIEKAPDGDGPTGRIKLGTESNGGFENIVIRDCSFEHCRGLALETVDGAPMKNVRVSNLQMNDICNSPIYIRLGDRMRGPANFHPSTVEDIYIENINVKNADSRYGCIIAGEEGRPVRNVTIKNVCIEYEGGLTLEDVRNQRGSNPFFFHKKVQPRTKELKKYPEPSAHGIQPAWGFNIYYAENILLQNIKLSVKHPDERPSVFQSSTQQVKFQNPNNCVEL